MNNFIEHEFMSKAMLHWCAHKKYAWLMILWIILSMSMRLLHTPCYYVEVYRCVQKNFPCVWGAGTVLPLSMSHTLLLSSATLMFSNLPVVFDSVSAAFIMCVNAGLLSFGTYTSFSSVTSSFDTTCSVLVSETSSSAKPFPTDQIM